MSDELVKRLRERCILAGFSKKLVREATDHIEALTAERDRLHALLAEADRRISWEAHGFGNDFADQVQSALKGETP